MEKTRESTRSEIELGETRTRVEEEGQVDARAPNKELRIKKRMLRRCNISLLSSVSRGISIQPPLCFFPTSNFHAIKGSPPTRETYRRRAAYFLERRRRV